MHTFKRTAAIMALVATTTVGWAQYWVIGEWVTPYSVTNSGQVAGYDFNEYFMWSRGGGYVGIGGVTPGNGHGGIPSISADGLRVGGTSMNSVTGKSEISYYDVSTGQWSLLGSLGSSSGDSASAGFAMSRNGQHIVGNGWIDAGNAHAVRWSGGSLVDLGSSIADRSSRADGVSNDGSLIGGYQDREDGYRSGAVWVNGVQVLLENADGDPLAAVHAVSADGQWAVGGGGWYLNGSAYRWNPTSGVHALDNPFTAEGLEMFATAVSDDGSVIVGVARDPMPWGSPDQGWVWTEATGTVRMADYLTSIGVSTTDILSNPLGISPDGRTIVGYGYDVDFTTSVAWQVSNPVPEPGTMLALGSGLAALVARRRRRA